MIDRYSISDQPATTAEGYRLVWYHSLRKAELDAVARSGRIERALKQLAALAGEAPLAADPLPPGGQGGRGGGRDPADRAGRRTWIVTEVQPQTEETFHQDHRGRPGKDTRYVKKVATRFDLGYRIDDARVAADATQRRHLPAGHQCHRAFASWNCCRPTSGSRRSRSGSRS